jgi:hypothetical protein
VLAINFVGYVGERKKQHHIMQTTKRCSPQTLNGRAMGVFIWDHNEVEICMRWGLSWK